MANVNPPTGHQGDTNLNVALTGMFTSWVNGVSPASFGPGITVNSLTVANAISATANISISSTAAFGSRTVAVTTGGQVATDVGGFSVIAGVPALVSASPGTGQTGATLNVVVNDAFTNFVQGTSVVNFGSSITANSVTVASTCRCGRPQRDVHAFTSTFATTNSVIPLNVSTGFTAGGTLSTVNNTPNANWTVKVGANPPVAASVVGPGDTGWYGGWAANGPRSSWIALDPNSVTGNAAGPYSTSVNLTGYNLNNLCLVGGMSIDDNGMLLVNGTPITGNISGQYNLYPLNIALPPGNTAVIVNLPSALLPNKTYTYNISGVTDYNGNPATSATSTFTTCTSYDFLQPGVSAFTRPTVQRVSRQLLRLFRSPSASP